MKVWSSRNKTPIFSHAEYVTERQSWGFLRRSGKMAPTRTPVRTSQVINCPGVSPKHVNKRAFGEKMSHRVPPSSPNGKLRIVSCPRVTASRISIVALNLPQAIAMNLLHGDHTAMSITEGNFMVAIVGSHDTGTPCTILTKG